MFNNIKIKLRKWLTGYLQGTYNHFLCYLPKKIGTFSFNILKLFYSGIRLDATQIPILKKIEGDAIVVYVTRNKSLFELLFYFVPCPFALVCEVLVEVLLAESQVTLVIDAFLSRRQPDE